ncbi:hypothetical protein ANCDUO_00046 [Ancylostoma duodenale]|uniref:ethanolamine kinase n=1 Tax=Ancylostoma duodenale TaxID=51022 RepID=A0A0C2E2D8_9BILA|nr:hypothetical protein ANCDUO_00046 [Ancylostoma duodenale]
MEKLSSNGLAAPLYARFANGIVCGYLKGKTISADQFKDLEMQRRICSTIAAYHNMGAPVKVIDDLFAFRKTRDFIKNIDVPAAKGLLHFASQLSDNLEEIQSLVVPLNEEITFCHNDLLAHNIIFDECSGKFVRF